LDEHEIREFVETTYSKLVAALTLICGSQAAAEDAVQEALVRAWERTERGQPVESLPAWVTTVSLNLARSGLRRLLAERRASRRLEVLAVDPTPLPETAVDVERALRRLSQRQREVTVLRYYGGLDVAEIAAALDVSEGTVKTQLARARHALAITLGPGDERAASPVEQEPQIARP